MGVMVDSIIKEPRSEHLFAQSEANLIISLSNSLHNSNPQIIQETKNDKRKETSIKGSSSKLEDNINMTTRCNIITSKPGIASSVSQINSTHEKNPKNLESTMNHIAPENNDVFWNCKRPNYQNYESDMPKNLVM